MTKNLFTTTLLESLNDKPYRTAWDFGYYKEYLKLTKIGDFIKVELELDAWGSDTYVDGTRKFTEIVKPSEIADFFNSRLSEQRTAIVNGRQIDMNDILEEFTYMLKLNVAKNNTAKNLERFYIDLPKLQNLMPSTLDVDWSGADAEEQFDARFEWEYLLGSIETALREETTTPYETIISNAIKGEVENNVNLIKSFYNMK